MPVDDVIARLAERYRALPAPRVPKRKRRSEVDTWLPVLRQFTMRRLYAQDPREFSLSRLADEIAQKSGRRFHKDTVRKTLIKHKLYQLWGEHDENC